MVESGHSGIPVLAEAQAFAPDLEIAALRMKAADRFDPVRFHFLETLTGQTLQHQGEVRRILDGKLAAALAAYKEGFKQAQNEAEETLARVSKQHPEAADDVQRLFTAGDYKEMRRFVARLGKKAPRSAFADLIHHIAQHLPENPGCRPDKDSGSAPELKTLSYFRNTWSKLSVDRQIAQAIEQAPENAGPINSHMLVLRSLALMRDISPDYLNRFMSYADTLLWLDQADNKNKPMTKKPPMAKTGARTKGAGSRSR